MNSLKMDEHNRIWVSSISNNIKMNKWRVFNQHGKLLAQFTWSQHQSLEAIKTGMCISKKGIKKARCRLLSINLS
ncbi:MAG TPA: hypothetical protein VKA34_07095 [Balneolales bacterium]|nr:hypothetical protein [Balneolales bacterium]